MRLNILGGMGVWQMIRTSSTKYGIRLWEQICYFTDFLIVQWTSKWCCFNNSASVYIMQCYRQCMVSLVDSHRATTNVLRVFVFRRRHSVTYILFNIFLHNCTVVVVVLIVSYVMFFSSDFTALTRWIFFFIFISHISMGIN